MISKWTQHLNDQEDIERFSLHLKGCRPAFERLKQILTEMEDAIEVSEINIKSYETPSWPYVQAHKNGQKAILTSLKKLITFDQKETT